MNIKVLEVNSARFLCLLVFVSKLILYLYLKSSDSFVGGGNDSDYYESYALGFDGYATSVWPVFLRFLNDIGMYNRVLISFLMFLISSFIIPVVFAKLIVLSFDDFRYNVKIYWNSIFFISLYPILFFMTLDIYRDVVMFSVFCLSLFYVQKKYNSQGFSFNIFYFLGLSLLLFLLRPYLGVASVLAYFIAPFINIKRYLIFLLIVYIVALMVFYSLGFFDYLVQYRGENGFSTGGTSLGIGLIDKNPFEFVYLFLYSMLSQLFGFYFSSLQSVLAFFAESFVFVLLFVYLISNRKLITPFINFLLAFVVIYATVWVISNDNLGTALRLRFYCYFSIFVASVSIFFAKRFELTLRV